MGRWSVESGGALQRLTVFVVMAYSPHTCAKGGMVRHLSACLRRTYWCSGMDEDQWTSRVLWFPSVRPVAFPFIVSGLKPATACYKGPGLNPSDLPHVRAQTVNIPRNALDPMHTIGCTGYLSTSNGMIFNKTFLNIGRSSFMISVALDYVWRHLEEWYAADPSWSLIGHSDRWMPTSQGNRRWKTTLIILVQ